jgi:YVTN family beta-propeller protein
VNPVTNQVYVTNSNIGTVTVINGATNATTSVTVGTVPYAVAVNPVTNTVYVANSSSNTVTVINGATNATTSVTVGTVPVAVAVNPVTNQVYVANWNNGSGTVTVIDVDGTQGQQTVPISVSTAAPTNDPLTVAAANASLGTPYITENTAPTLTATVTSAYTTSSTYSGDTTQTPANPPPTALYYQVDGGSGAWSQATVTSTAGSTTATFSVPLTAQSVGLHTVYLYAAYGDEGVPASSGNGSGNSPEISNLSAFLYTVLPLPTMTTLTADTNPQSVNGSVTFTATVSPTTGTATVTGTVDFYDSITGTQVLLGAGTLGVVNGSDIAELQTNFSATGSHPITAVYGGDTAYAGSTGSLTETIGNSPTATTVVATTTLTENHAATSFTPVTGSGGTGTLTYSVSPSLPTGLTMSSSTGAITGTPTVASAATTYTVTITDADGLTATATFSLTVDSAVSATTVVATTALTENHAATSFTPVTVSGGTGTLSYGVSPTLPAGLSFSTTTGAITGTPTVTSAATTYTVTITDQNSATATATFSLTVAAPIGTIPPTVTVTPSASTITNLQSVSVTITVGGSSGQATPTGSVTLTSGSYSAQQALSSGTASFNIPAGTLSAGANTLTASYSGDATYSTSSGTTTVTVSSVVISVSALSPSPITPGASATATATLTAGSSYSGTMNMTCTLTSSPTGAQSLPTCSFNPASVTLATGGNGTTVLAVQTIAATTSALVRPSGLNLWGLGGGGATLAGLLMFCVPSRRRRLLSMLTLLVVVVSVEAIGCGGGGGSSPAPTSTPATTAGSYTFTVTATEATNASITTSTNVAITVQ